MNFKNKWTLGISIGTGLILFICIVVPFLRENYLYWRLGYIDITPVLIQEGDLPNGFIAGNIADIEPYYYKSARAKEQKILASDGTKAGSVSVYLFASSSEQGDLYTIASQVESQEGIIPYNVTGLGDCESCGESVFATDYGIHVVFTQCTALVLIDLNAEYLEQKEYDFDYLVAHAKRLDDDLKSIACK